MNDSNRSTVGPLDGPIRWRDHPGAIGGYAPEPTDRLDMPIGIALPVGRVEHPRGPVATSRLVVGNDELPGLYACDRRRFVRVDEDDGQAVAAGIGAG